MWCSPANNPGVWTFDTGSGQYYLHRFYHHQPDLNIANPAVRDEIAKVIGFWLAQGMSGFRVDAVPFLLELDGIVGQIGMDPHQYLRDLRAFVQRRNGDAILLGEVNLPFDEQRLFFGDEDGDELSMLFDFIGMQSIHLAMARGDARPIVRALRDRPEVPADATYASFLRNHDELTLDKLTESERSEVFAAFGPDPDMQLYDRGLRRRLPTMLGGDQQWLRMAYSLMFAMPGAPTLFYGEEIGMGENLAIDGRLAVRTPMQWTSGPTAGFTTAPASAACRPFPDDQFGPDTVNVAAQRTDPDSLLNWFERLIRLRKSAPEIGWGEHLVVDSGNDAVLVLQYRWDDRTAITVHNLAGRAHKISIPLDVDSATLRDRLGSAAPIAVKNGRAAIKIAARGYHWFVVEPAP